MRAAPSTTYGGISIVPSSGLSGLFTTGGASDSSNRVRGLDARPSILVGGAAQYSASRGATYSSEHKERSVFFLTVMTPRGPGILSLR